MNNITIIFRKLRSYHLFIIFIFIFFQSKSQNLVPNSSFEKFIDFDTTRIEGWHKIQNSDTPDYFNFGGNTPNNQIFDEYIGGAKPHTGNGFIGLFCYRVQPERDIKNIREYIETKLNKPLEKDSLYKIEISLCLDEESNVAIKNFGLLFSQVSLKTNKNYKSFSTKPQVEFSFSYPDSMHNWTTLYSLYRANGNEKYVIIGNFRNDIATSIKKIVTVKSKKKKQKWSLTRKEYASYYYVDDLIIEKAPTDDVRKSFGQLKEEIKDTLNIEKLKIDSVVVLRNIIFEFNKYDLLPQSFSEINKLYYLMFHNPSIKIKLEGYTDSIGSYDFNLQLSIKRAETVARYLIEKGINSDRIGYAGYGYSFPLVSNGTEEGRKLNRRVTFKIIEK